MRLALVANPGSGKRLEPSDVRQRLEAHGADVVLCEEGWRGDEETLALMRGADRIVAAGGDGIVGPCAALAADLGLPLAVMPTGTANDFARDQRLPMDADAAAELAVRGNGTRRLELARMRAPGEDGPGRPYVNAAAAGLSPLAAERALPLKPRLGPLAYAAGAILAGLTGRPIPCVARVDGAEVFDGRAWQVIVAATGAFGAGADIAEADPHDGELDLVIVPDGPRLLLPYRAAGMRRHTLAGQSGVVHTEGRAIELDVPDDTAFNVDGEIVHVAGGTLHFTALHAAFTLVCD